MAAASGHALLGSYQPATLIAVQAGLYEVRFDDGSRKWATSCELLSTEAPTSPPEDGSSVAMLTIDGSENYTQATFGSQRQHLDRPIISRTGAPGGFGSSGCSSQPELDREGGRRLSEGW